MGVLFHFLSSLKLTCQSNVASSHQSTGWKDRAFWLPAAQRKERELARSSIQTSTFLLGPLLFAAHQELWILARTCYAAYLERKEPWFPSSFDLARIDLRSIAPPWEWSVAWRERVLPSVLKYQATLLTMSFYEAILSLFASKVAFYQLTQHPYYRARFLASSDSDRLSVGMKALTMSLWSNFLFYLASLTVNQVSLYYTYRKEYKWALIRRDGAAKERSTSHWVQSSWELLRKHSTRYCGSAFGAAVGSALWPGWGTLFGIGMGDEWAEAEAQSTPKPPSLFLALFPRLQLFFSSSTAHRESKVDANELLCGCCQVNYFSADANHPARTPISSRVCDHTICKSCVEMCHLALMGRSNIFIESIKCPLCNTHEAFRPHDPIINRTLCDAISLIEKTGHTVPSCDIEIDAATVEKLGKLTRLGTSRSTNLSSDTITF